MYVMNPVRGLPSDCHQRLPIDSHTAQTVTHYLGLHFPSSIALITHRCNLALLISQLLPLSGHRVLFSIYHFDSYFTDPVLVFSLVLVLPCLFPVFRFLPVYFRLPFRLAVWTLFAPAWTITVYLDYLSLFCHVGLRLSSIDPRLFTGLLFCLAFDIPVYHCLTLACFDHVF